MEAILEDIIFNILLWLPVISLLKFRCVCKCWRDIIDSKNFVQLHLKRGIEGNKHHLLLKVNNSLYSTNCSILNPNELELERINFPIRLVRDYSYRSTFLINSCNGLVCIDLSDEEESIIIWNPCMRQLRSIPSIDYVIEEYLSECYVIYCLYGFGYDNTMDDYKVVRIIDYIDNKEIQVKFNSQVHVYTLGKNSWRMIEGSHTHYLSEKAPPIYFNESLHWLAKSELLCLPTKSIVSFDCVDEEFHLVLVPDSVEEIMSIAVMEGCFSMLVKTNEFKVDAWIMKNYGVKDSWSKLLTISNERVIQSIDFEEPVVAFLKPLYYSQIGKILFDRDKKDLVLCNTTSEHATQFPIPNLQGLIESQTYVESLISFE